MTSSNRLPKVLEELKHTDDLPRSLYADELTPLLRILRTEMANPYPNVFVAAKDITEHRLGYIYSCRIGWKVLIDNKIKIRLLTRTYFSNRKTPKLTPSFIEKTYVERISEK